MTTSLVLYCLRAFSTTIWGPIGAYTPFLEPLPLDTYWLWLMGPLVFAISIVYKTLKLDDIAQLPRQAAYLAAQIGAFMILAAAVLWLITSIA